MVKHLHTMIIVIAYNFCSLKTSFFIIMNPTYRRNILHILYGYFSRIHLLILNLKTLRDSDSFASLDTKSGIFGPREGNDSASMPGRIYSPSLKSIVITTIIWTHFRGKKFFHNF